MFLARSPIRSRSVATRMAPTISRRSIAIGWRRAMVSTARSSMVRCRMSISRSEATTRLPSTTSRRISASTESVIMRSTRPPISATSRVNSCRSLSNALAVCSEAIVVLLDHDPTGMNRIMIPFACLSMICSKKPASTFSDHALAKPAGDVVLGASIARRGENLAGFAELDQLAQVHERGLVGDTRSLLHVVGDDRDGVVLGKLLDQLLHLGSRDRVQRRARLVEQDHLGPHGDGSRNAQPLLLAAGQAQARGVQLVLDLVPQRATTQRLFHPAVHLRFGDLLVEADAEGDVLVDRHRKRRRLLEYHADPRPQQIEVELGVENVGMVQHQLAGGALAGIKVVHPVED